MREAFLDWRVRAGLGRNHETTGRARGAIGVVVRVVKRRAGFFDVRACIRSLAAFK